MTDQPVTRKFVVVHVVESLASGVLEFIRRITWSTNTQFRHIIIRGNRTETPEDLNPLFPKDTRVFRWKISRDIAFVDDLIAQLELRRFLNQIKPDIVHAHSSKGGAHGRLANMGGTVPCCYSPNGYAFLQKNWSPIKQQTVKSVEWILGRLPHTTIACGEAESAHAGRVARNHVMIPNMIDLSEIDTALWANKKFPTYTVTMMGRISPQKNFKLFAQVAEQLLDESIKFIWVGDGSTDIQLPANMKVTGWLNKTDALRVLGRSHVYFQSSLWEGLSFALLEAMALYLPIVAYPCEANAELVEDEKNGYLESTIDDISERLLFLMRQDVVRKEMGKESRKKIESAYTSTIVGPKWCDYYNRLIKYKHK